MRERTDTQTTRAQHRQQWTRRFVISAVLATPLFVLEMGGHLRLLNLDHYASMAASLSIQFALATPIVLWQPVCYIPLSDFS